MQIKIKTIKTTLLVFFLLIAFGISISISAQNNSSGAGNIFLDSDQDGLSDEEELVYGTDPENSDTDGDGYSDGAEVKSGYDPLKPAPGDKITTDSSPTKKFNINTDISSGDNLTDDLSNKIAVLMSDEDATSTGITVSDINSMIESNMPKDMQIAELPEIDRSTIKIKDQTYSKLDDKERALKIQEDEDEYLSLVLYIASNNLPHNISLEGEAQSFLKEVTSKINNLYAAPEEMTYFTNLAEKGGIILTQMQDIEVPESMLDLHVEGLQLAKYSISLKDKVRIDREDPISSIISLSSVESLLVMSADFIEKIEARDTNNVLAEEPENSEEAEEEDSEDEDTENSDQN